MDQVIDPLVGQIFEGNKCIHYMSSIKKLLLTCKNFLPFLMQNKWDKISHSECNWCGFLCEWCNLNGTIQCEKCTCIKCGGGQNINNLAPVFDGQCYRCVTGMVYNKNNKVWEYTVDFLKYIKFTEKLQCEYCENIKLGRCLNCVCICCGKNNLENKSAVIRDTLYCHHCHWYNRNIYTYDNRKNVNIREMRYWPWSREIIINRDNMILRITHDKLVELIITALLLELWNIYLANKRLKYKNTKIKIKQPKSVRTKKLTPGDKINARIIKSDKCMFLKNNNNKNYKNNCNINKAVKYKDQINRKIGQPRCQKNNWNNRNNRNNCNKSNNVRK